MFWKIRVAVGVSSTLVGLAGIPDDIRGWLEMLTLLEWWSVRAALVLLGIALLTYPLWVRVIRVRFEIADNESLWAGLQFWWGWTLEGWREKRRPKKGAEVKS